MKGGREGEKSTKREGVRDGGRRGETEREGGEKLTKWVVTASERER